MIYKDKIPKALVDIMTKRTDVDWDKYEIPPPVFTAMHGECISFDLNTPFLCCRFPVLAEQLNPYGKMQGGIISAAIDNTIGPLSLLVALPNVTRKAEVKYLHAIDAETDFIYVTAKFITQKKNFLYFEASVENKDKTIKYATSKFTNWIV